MASSIVETPSISIITITHNALNLNMIFRFAKVNFLISLYTPKGASQQSQEMQGGFGKELFCYKSRYFLETLRISCEFRSRVPVHCFVMGN